MINNAAFQSTSFSFPSTAIIRHRRENLKKCSLQGLEARQDFTFFTYPCQNFPPLGSSPILLTLDAAPLSIHDAQQGLLILDATWRYAKTMLRWVEKHLPSPIKRSIPAEFRTAYPRRQEDCANPDRGLASIEAIFIAYLILGRNTDGLLDHYYWKENFLEINRNVIDFYS